MEQKNNFEKYLKTMYEFYKNNNFQSFINKILSYNIAIGSYKKNIEELSKSIFNKILKLDIDTKNIIYKENKNYFYIENNNNEYNENNNILLDIPVFEENYELISLNLVKYCFNTNIDFSIKLSKYIKNTILQIKVNNINDANKIIDHFIENKDIKETVKSRTLPFLYQIGLIGIYTENKPYSFKNIFIQYLYLYYSKIKNENDIDLDSFIKYIEGTYKNEKKINKKRILNILYNYILIIKNEENIFNLFKSNSVMDLSSFQANDYNLKLDENQMIYFINKLDPNIEIRYGNEDYFNLAYSKYYENVIKKEKSDKYYNLFYEKFDKILINNYDYIDEILEMTNTNMDKINKILLISSSLFFAHKKMNFSYKQISIIMQYLLKIMDNYNKDEINKKEYFEKYILNNEYANKVVTLKNGNNVTMKEYLIQNNIINNIPANCYIELKDGSKLSGKEFIDNLYKFIPNYDNYKELTKNLIDTIEY